jgi:non-specific serine/threonine protein kinase
MRRLLVVLDNCEHLVAACAALADALLRNCLNVRILATSRQPLGVAGETTWRVPRLSESEATRLFVERARAVEPGWAITDQNAPAVGEVCQRLDGIPLAIELAAARVAVLAPEQIAARLVDRLSLLTGGSRTSPPRHQTLRATLDWSYSLLRPCEQLLFNRLSVFAGGWSLEAAETVCAGARIAQSTILDLLAQLINQSLVLAGHGDGVVLRYRLLETLREYGTERLAGSGAAEAVLEKHASFFLTLAERNEPELFGSGAIAAQATLEREHDNIRGALRWFVAHGDAERAQRLAGSVARFWFYRGYFAEGGAWLAQVLALPQPGATAGRAKSLYGAGTINMMRGDYSAAETALRKALRLWRELGNAAEEGFALYVLGLVAGHRGDRAEGYCLFEEGVAVSRAAACRPAEANNLAGLADMAREQGQFTDALARGEDALKCSSAAGWMRGIVHSLWALGDINYQMGDYDTATNLLEASLATSREMGAQYLVASTLARLGVLSIERLDLSEAHALLVESLSLCRDIGDRQGIARGLEGFAQLACVEEQPETALRLMGAAATLRTAIGAHLSRMEAAQLERRVAPARETAGESASDAAWAAGHALSLQQALAIAMGTTTVERTRSPRSESPR